MSDIVSINLGRAVGTRNLISWPPRLQVRLVIYLWRKQMLTYLQRVAAKRPCRTGKRPESHSGLPLCVPRRCSCVNLSEMRTAKRDIKGDSTWNKQLE